METAPIEIRAFHRGDGEAFRLLNEEWITKYFRLEAPDFLVLGDPERHILQPGGSIEMAFSGDEAIGCCALIPTGRPGTLELAKMAVAPAWRGRGIGRRLLEHTIGQARLRGAKSLELESNAILQDAIHLYESVGFVHREGPAAPSEYTRTNVFMEMQLQRG